MATGKLYGNFLKQALNKEHDLDSDTIKVSLRTSSYTVSQDGDDYYGGLASNEVSGTGYTAGGKTLTSPTVTYTGATNKLVFDAADLSWTSATISGIRYAVIYNDTPASTSAKGLIGYQDAGSDVSVSGGTFDLIWNASGIVEITVA